MILPTQRDQRPAWLLPARRRTWRRWVGLALSRHSTLRHLQYEALRSHALEGRILDVGGGSGVDYTQTIIGARRVVSVNRSARTKPALVADARGLPLRASAFDTAITLNTLEHVYEDGAALGEMFRTLRPGGRFHVLVPFLYRVHDAPDDYHRRTAFWWRRTCEACGADPASIEVEPLVWDRLLSAYSLMGDSLRGRCLRAAVALVAVARDLVSRGDRVPDTAWNRRLADYAVGYSIRGRTRYVHVCSEGVRSAATSLR